MLLGGGGSLFGGILWKGKWLMVMIGEFVDILMEGWRCLFYFGFFREKL